MYVVLEVHETKGFGGYVAIRLVTVTSDFEEAEKYEEEGYEVISQSDGFKTIGWFD